MTSPRNNPAPRLERSFYRREVRQVARALLGQRLVRLHEGRRLAGLIVETEAYLGVIDRAAHTWNGRRTARNESMWQEAGHLYVYFTYGMHHCLNVVAGRAGLPVAVLIRALEPVEGVEAMRRRRSAARDHTGLCSGPAKLTQALAVDRALDGDDLTKSGRIWIEQERRRSLPASRIRVTPRIGIAYAEDWADRPLRFVVDGNPHVSRR